MPGPSLMPGVDQRAYLGDVIVHVEVGFWETQKECHEGLWESGNGHQSILACLLNFCVIPACSTVYVGDGTVKQCDVYLAWNWWYMFRHEIKHCQGYADSFY
jgi:hypothetical protein